MLNNEWENNLRDLLGDYKPEGLPPNWDEFSNQMDQMAELNEIGDDPVFDEHLKESIGSFEAPSRDAGWLLIKASLDTADKKFDDDIRKRITQFEPKYDPRTWPLFLQRLADSNFLRAKLIALKVVEVAAVFLILFTLVNMGRMGKLPFNTPLYNKSKNDAKLNTSHDGMADNASGNKNYPSAILSSTHQENEFAQNENSNSSSTAHLSNKNLFDSNKATAKPFQASIPSSGIASNLNGTDFTKVGNVSPERSVTIVDPIIQAINGPKEPLRSENTITSLDEGPLKMSKIRGSLSVSENDFENDLIASNTSASRAGNLDFLESMTSPVIYANLISSPQPNYIKQRKSTHTVFGILVQGDYNRLRMPEDRLSSAGRVIVFPQQGIPSYGYGGGFTVAIDHPRYAVESGLIYNTKTFEPGRKLAVGTAFDNGVVEFEAMRLQLISIPVQLRYKVENKGPFKFYALAGVNLNLIVQSDIDVSVKYHFPSLSANENPNSNPGIANTIKESRRVSEHIRDGAPLSTKSFMSAVTGLGIEYSFNEHKTFFLQTAAQYQIPNLTFSNNNGKHIRSVSIQTGVRTPLGK